MPVVFDEVVGNVVADNPAPQTESETKKPQPTVPEAERLRYLLRHMERRAARLRAD